MPRSERSVLVLLVFATLVAPRSAMAGSPVSNQKLGVAFTLPDGFAGSAAAADGKAAPMTFTRGQVGAASFAVLQVAPLPGTIGPGKLDRKIVEDSARAGIRGSAATITGFDYRTARWKTFDLDLVVGRVSNQDRHLVTFSTQVPLVHHALQVSLTGPEGDEARLATEFQSILSGLDGESNWLNDRQRSERLGRVVGMLVGALAGGVVILAIFLRRQRQQRGA